MNEMFDIVAIDPGKSTGLAWQMNDGGYATCTEPDWLKVLDAALCFKTVILERYRVIPNLPSNHNEPMWITGALYYSVERGCGRPYEVITQDPYFRKGALKIAGDMKIHKSDHELDALAHLLMYQRCQRST